MNFCTKNNCCEYKLQTSYIKKILEMLGPVLLGSKPTEILNISGNIEEKHFKLIEIKSFFNNCSKISYKVINTHDNGIRILFINQSSLERTLSSNKRAINFLKFIGYPNIYNLNEYIDTLIHKLHSEDFPNEIGIFLGYPLKDVLGFMGYGKLKLSTTRSWKIYGDTSISDEIYNRFLKDRETMKSMINANSIIELKNII